MNFLRSSSRRCERSSPRGRRCCIRDSPWAGVELEEEVQRLIGALALALVALVAILLALIVGTFTIVVAVSPENRLATMLIITAVYFVVALLLVLRIRSVFQGRPPIFGATLAELEKDKSTWSEMARTQDLAEELAAVRARAARGSAFADVRSSAPNPADPPR